MGPTVSVVIPTFNRCSLVRRAALSALQQSISDIEVLVVDDGSTDDVAGSLASFGDERLKVIRRHRNGGAAAARNTGIESARGTFVAFLDSDDCWYETKLERQLRFMRAFQKTHAASCTGFRVVSPHDSRGEVRLGPNEITLGSLIDGCHMSPGSTLMVERRLFTLVGPQNESFARLEDMEWLIRCSQKTRIGVLREELSLIDQCHSRVSYPAVKLASRAMWRADIGVCEYSPAARARLLSTLQTELAASAYRAGRYLTAIGHFVLASIINPMAWRRHWARVLRILSVNLPRACRGAPRPSHGMIAAVS